MVKNPPAIQETWVRFLGWGRSPGGGHGNPLQYSCLETPKDRGAGRATVHGVTKAWTRLENSNQKDPAELSYMRALNHLSPGLLSTRENACTLSLWVGISALLLS